VLKKFIYSANIYDPYSGGLSSYGLILMIVAFLQNENRERKSRGLENQKVPTIAELLIGFLYFYGFKSNYIGKQIRILDAEKAKAEIGMVELGKYLEQPIYEDAMDIVDLYPNVTSR
jgi:DNA polymerase sigma